MLRYRLLTAAILVAILFYSVSFSSTPIVPLIFFVISITLVGAEFIALRWQVIDGRAQIEKRKPLMRKEFFCIAATYSICLPVEYFGQLYFGQGTSHSTSLVFSWVALCATAGSVLFYMQEIDLNCATQKLMNALAGFVYVAIPGITLFKLSQIQINNAPQGIALYFSLAVIFMGDTGAYFSGRYLGKHKLIPRVSPKKTIEGAVGGLLASAATGIFMCFAFHLPFHWLSCASIAVLAGVSGQIGDLTESALKRSANCKDSGTFLPGHGGALDRSDALLFGVPISYLIFNFMGSF